MEERMIFGDYSQERASDCIQEGIEKDFLAS